MYSASAEQVLSKHPEIWGIKRSILYTKLNFPPIYMWTMKETNRLCKAKSLELVTGDRDTQRLRAQ